MSQLTIYCHELKAARHDAVANLKCFGAAYTRDLISMVTYTFAMRRHLIRAAHITAIYFFPFGNVWLGSVSVCNAWEVQCKINEGWVRTLIVFSALCGPKFTKYSDDVESPLYFPTPFSICLCHISFRRYSPLSLEVDEKWRKCKTFLAPNFCGRNGSDFSTAVC